MKYENVQRSLALRGYFPVKESLWETEGTQYSIWRRADGERLLVALGEAGTLQGTRCTEGEDAWCECPLTHENLLELQKRFPELKPVSMEGHRVTMGLGDRLGLVSGAQLAALVGTAVFPVLAQQSKRELNLTGRSYRQMLEDVAWQVFESGYRGGYAADGDHLKTLGEVCNAIDCGATMITLDCSEHIAPDAYRLSEDEAAAQCRERFPEEQLAAWRRTYRGKTFAVSERHSVSFSGDGFFRLILTYGAALDFMETVYRRAIVTAPRKVSFEISIDETDVATTPEAHYFIAHQLTERGIEVSSIAPRFCGEFQKGVDYRGDIEQFQLEFSVHAAIARAFGYRISVHSGSDKFSIFPYVGKLSGGSFHIKTSGTSWVEAVRVIAMCDAALFRRMAAFSCLHFEEARKYYHVSASTERFPDLRQVADEDLPALLDETDVRQIMHITYGFLLQAKDERGKDVFRADIYRTLRGNKELLDEVIKRHIQRHLALLGVAGAE